MTMLTFDPATTALVVVDMQNDFCDAGGFYARIGRDISAFAAVIQPIDAMATRVRAAGMPVVFTRLVHDPVLGAIEERHALRPKLWTTSGKRLMPGSDGADVVAGLSVHTGDIVIDKVGYSAFAGTDFAVQLRDRGIRTLLFCGVVTYACVLSSAFAAFDEGFDVVLLEDLVGTWDDRLGQDSGRIVDLLLGHTVPSDSLIFQYPAERSAGRTD
jgi:nicotinamidase-related amidase